MKPLYIFDLDGTLALIQHRRHFVEGKKKDWPAFFRACVDDEPNRPVIDTLWRLVAGGADIWIWSGRSDEVRYETQEWIHKHVAPAWGWPLKMRREGDYTPDHILKKSWLDAISQEERQRLVAIFDDRDRVVQMWRENGVAAFQVAPGDF